jgi:hypothetical protein
MANQSAEIEPYITLRGHTGPIMAMCGYEVTEESQINESLTNIVISGGINGNIMIWRVPSRKEAESAKSDNQYQVACWDRAHES